MIELFTYKQIHCEHCGFEFSFTGFGSAAKIVCPACGEENALPLPPPQPVVPPVSAKPQPEFSGALPQSTAEKPILCSIEHCPLLTGSESGNANVGNAIAEQMGLRLRQRKNRRRMILAWTITLQVCVLLGIALFVAKTLLIPKENTGTLSVAVDTGMDTKQTIVEIPSPIHIAALPAETETKTAQNNTLLDNDPFTAAVEPEHVFSPFETAQGVFPPPVYDFQQPQPPVDSPITAPNVLPANPGHITETTLPLPLTTELSATEPMTLEMADDLLESAKAILATDTENSIKQAVQAAKIYEQLEQPFPDSMYWILSNALASLSWGEPLLESSPAVETMTLSPDNRYLLTQLKDKTVWLWDLQNSERAGYLLDSGTAEYVKFIFTPDLHWIIGGQANGTIRIWNMSLKNPADSVVTFMERIPDLQDLQISPNGQWLAAFGRSPRNTYLSENRQPGQLTPSPSIQQVNYQRSDRFHPSEVSPYPVLLWNLRQMENGVIPIAITVPSMPQPVQVIQFSPNSDRLAVGRKDSIVRVYDLTVQGVNNEPFVLRGHQLGITQIVFAPSGQWIATGSQDNTVRLWNLTSSKASPESATLYGHIGWISTLTIDQTGEYLCSGSYDRTIRIWNIKRDRIGTALKEEPIILETNLGVPESLLITQDGDKIIALGNEGCLGIYHFHSLFGDDTEEHFRAVTFRNSKLSISKCLVTSDNQLLIFSYEHTSNPSNNGIRLWSLQPEPFVQ